MSRTDPRLEAAREAVRQLGPISPPYEFELRRTVAIHDALRAFDQAQLDSCDDTPESAEQWRNQLIQLLAHFAIETGSSCWRARIDRLLRKLREARVKTEPQPESEMERSYPCKGAGDCVGHPHDCYDHPHNCGCAKAATREEVMPHKPGPVHHEGPDNATAPVMGADPPWLNECRDFAWSHTGKKPHATDPEIARAQNAIIRRVLAFANAQPPSSDQVMTALSVYLRHLGHYSTVVDPAGIEAMRAALIAAAKARSGG